MNSSNLSNESILITKINNVETQIYNFYSRQEQLLEIINKLEKKNTSLNIIINDFCDLEHKLENEQKKLKREEQKFNFLSNQVIELTKENQLIKNWLKDNISNFKISD